MTILFILIFILIIVITSVIWVTAIDYMIDNHPDYKGDDFLE